MDKPPPISTFLATKHKLLRELRHLDWLEHNLPKSLQLQNSAMRVAKLKHLYEQRPNAKKK